MEDTKRNKWNWWVEIEVRIFTMNNYVSQCNGILWVIQNKDIISQVSIERNYKLLRMEYIVNES